MSKVLKLINTIEDLHKTAKTDEKETKDNLINLFHNGEARAYKNVLDLLVKAKQHGENK